MDDEYEASSASAPAEVRLTRVVSPACRARTNTSATPLVSPATSPSASEVNDTHVPSPLIAGLADAPLPSVPELLTLTRVVTPDCRSRRKTSLTPLVSPATRLVATDSNTTYRPSELMAGQPQSPSASAPAVLTLARTVSPVWQSWTKISRLASVSPVTRLVARDSKATYRPSPLIAGALETPLPSVPALLTLILVVVPPAMSCRKTSVVPLPSPVTRFVASDGNATYLPSSLRAGWDEASLPSVPELEILTRDMVAAPAMAASDKHMAARTQRMEAG